MEEEQLYCGVRRSGTWTVHPIERLTSGDLQGVDVLRDVHCAWVIGFDAERALRDVSVQAARGVDPFVALESEARSSPGLELLRQLVIEARSRSPSPQQAPASDRERTDQSLQLERESADSASRFEVSAFEEIADAFICKARARADATLWLERAASHQSEGNPSADVSKTRAEEDRALLEWRESVDADRAARRVVLTEHRTRTEEQLGLERAHADEIVSERDDVLAMAGHELQNALGIMVGYAEAIEQATLERNFEFALSPARNIQRAGARMQRLIGDLVDASRAAAGGLSLTLVAGDVTSVVHEAVDGFMARASEHGVSLTVEAQPHLPLVEFDAARMLQVLVNLLSNALKFTPVGGRVSVHVQHVENEVRCAVTDTGSGIPKPMLETVFERFRRGHLHTRPGLGLGLYIAKCIVEGQEGRIWAENDAGGGTTVCLTLPVRVPSSPAEADRSTL